MSTQNFKTPPPSVPNTLLSFPAPHVLLVTLNRPAQLNAIPTPQHKRLAALWDWFDAEPALRCAVITGAGRAFCAGADLKEWNELHGKFQQREKDGRGLVDGVEHGGQYGTVGKRREALENASSRRKKGSSTAAATVTGGSDGLLITGVGGGYGTVGNRKEALRNAEGVKAGQEPDAPAERIARDGRARDGKMKEEDKLTTGIGGGYGTIDNRRQAISSAAQLTEEARKGDLNDVDDARITTGIGGGYGTVASRKAAAAARLANDSSRVGSLGLNAGFGGLSNRSGKKPIIAAVNGLCFGGGMEIVINCDIVIASSNARFGLPEVKVGVIAVAGALPRLVRTVGKQRAAEMALLGRNRYSAEQMERWGVVNFIVHGEKALVEEAVKLAEEISGNSPDAVLTSKEGLRLGWEGLGPEKATAVLETGMYRKLEKGENMKEGVASFVEKRKPVWKDSKL
ncbi:ClpP/crotonase-like domain-containing protein [Pseudoneurospora amorphoporcata]|uniref:ClpP/crotonase-like domain-containing protein n=1 Tax=Pseudoneurospora amorphoporcata TaxID=241081 RepID=A0AAN6SI60_9PEZI|nr:ClpP/crotonase-like domain-containing protein [Pseudoneurospora amorphoporcata]